MSSRKAVAETLPPTEGATAHNSLRAYIQSMSLNPIDYGLTLDVHGYEPVQTLYPMYSDERRKIMNRRRMQKWVHVNVCLWSLSLHYMHKM